MNFVVIHCGLLSDLQVEDVNIILWPAFATFFQILSWVGLFYTNSREIAALEEDSMHSCSLPFPVDKVSDIYSGSKTVLCGLGS